MTIDLRATTHDLATVAASRVAPCGEEQRSTELRGGLFIADDAIRLACDLEARGFALTAKDGKLLVGNGSALTAADRAGIVRLKRHLLAIVGVCNQCSINT